MEELNMLLKFLKAVKDPKRIHLQEILIKMNISDLEITDIYNQI